MVTMSAGSIADQVYNSIPNIPVALSGTLPNIVDQQIGFVSDRTGLTIDSANIQT